MGMRVTRRQLLELMLAASASAATGVRADETTQDAEQRAADAIRGYSSEGLHRTGTPVDRTSAERLLALARDAGARPALEPFEL